MNKKNNIKQVAFSTTLSTETKKILERFCKKKGVKINHFVEKAILEALEDEMDRAIIEERELEDTIEWNEGA